MAMQEGIEIHTGPRLHGYLPEASVISTCFGGALLLFGSIMLGNAYDREAYEDDTLAEKYHIPTGLLGGFILGIGLALLVFAVAAFLKMRRTAAMAVEFA